MGPHKSVHEFRCTLLVYGMIVSCLNRPGIFVTFVFTIKWLQQFINVKQILGHAVTQCNEIGHSAFKTGMCYPTEG